MSQPDADHTSHSLHHCVPGSRAPAQLSGTLPRNGFRNRQDPGQALRAFRGCKENEGLLHPADEDRWCAGRTSPKRLPIVRGSDELLVLLRTALEGEEVVIAAAAARKAPAQAGAGLIHRAAALLGIEEAADAAEDLVRLAPHGVLGPPPFGGELAARLLEREVEVLGEPLHVTLGQPDERIRAAVSGAFLAIVHRVAS